MQCTRAFFERLALRRNVPRPFRRPRPAQIVSLEPRTLLATFTVVNVNDAGVGSLRAAIAAANGMAGADVIEFNIGGGGAQTIALSSALPDITEAVIIDATTQTGFAGVPLIELDGAGAGSASGLVVTGGGTTIRGLVINGFAQHGVVLSSDGNSVEGCYIGTTANGAAADGNGQDGIRVEGLSNAIGGTTDAERNLISGNGQNGINVTSATASGNTVEGNTIGLDIGKTTAVPNGQNGVRIGGGATANWIGATSSAARNFISGNSGNGVMVEGTGTFSNVIVGNFIGNGSGSTAGVGNADHGIFLRSNTTGNTIGATNAGGRNVISGNGMNGVLIRGAGTTGNEMLGNRIGVNSGGTAALPNGSSGVRLDSGTNGNTIGRAVAGGGSLISGNAKYGIVLTGSGVSNNELIGNLIGTDAAGTSALGNSIYGVLIHDGANGNVLGEAQALAGNVISGNATAGVVIAGAGSNANKIKGNLIGLANTGSAGLPNGVGVWIVGGASSNIVGGGSALAKNAISGNLVFGVAITGAGTNNNQLLGNFIGGDATGINDVPNGFDGVHVAAGATNTKIGGTSPSTGNVISGNGRDGVRISGTGTTGNVVRANRIGLKNDGSTFAGNDGAGVTIAAGASGNTVGGTTSGVRNTISFNNSGGVVITGAGTDDNLVAGNYIGLDVTGVFARKNDLAGVRIERGASFNKIGDVTAGSGNTISGHDDSALAGVWITGTGTTGNTVQGNVIGLDASGTQKVRNDAGVRIDDGASDNLIGGTTAAARNIISGNGDGVLITFVGEFFNDFPTGNLVQGNYIGLDATGTSTDLGNRGGVVMRNLFSQGAPNIIGGLAPGARNVIANSQFDGVLIEECGQQIVQGNFIGTNAAGNAARGNQEGVRIRGSSNALIAGNVISGNNRTGVLIEGIPEGPGASNNRVEENFIGTRLNGTTPLGNFANGVFITAGAGDNIIGGTAAGDGNRIAHNGSDGVLVGLVSDFGFPFAAGTGNSILGNSISDNGGQGIDLGDVDGVTPNDSNDVDSPDENNGLQNFPILSFVATESGSTIIAGTLNSVLGLFRIEFFVSPAADGSGHGEGLTFLGFDELELSDSHNEPFAIALPVTVLPGQVITATATNISEGFSNEVGNTSEFSPAFVVPDNA